MVHCVAPIVKEGSLLLSVPTELGCSAIETKIHVPDRKMLDSANAHWCLIGLLAWFFGSVVALVMPAKANRQLAPTTAKVAALSVAVLSLVGLVGCLTFANS